MSRCSKAFANSRDVANGFGKRHADVLRDIKALFDSGEVERPVPNERNSASIDFWFVPARYTDDRNRIQISYDMTEEGFSLLAMGFTGAKALEFKVAYIRAFQAVRAERDRLASVVAPALPDFSNPAAAARAWASEYEHKQALQIENEKLKPLAAVGF